MKSFATAAKAAIVAGTAQTGGAVEILCAPAVRVWSGEGIIPIEGNSFKGIGARGLVKVTGGSIGAMAEKFTLVLSGLEPEALELLTASDLKGATVTIWRLVFDGSGTSFLDAQIFRRGRVDRIYTEETIKGTAAINVDVEGLARGLGRRGGRMRSDADQRLIDPTDSGMSRISYAGTKHLYWGGKPPVTAANALPNAAPSSGRTPNPVFARGRWWNLP